MENTEKKASKPKSKPKVKVVFGRGDDVKKKSGAYDYTFVWEDKQVEGSVPMKYPEVQGVNDEGLVLEGVRFIAQYLKEKGIKEIHALDILHAGNIHLGETLTTDDLTDMSKTNKWIYI